MADVIDLEKARAERAEREQAKAAALVTARDRLSRVLAMSIATAALAAAIHSAFFSGKQGGGQ